LLVSDGIGPTRRERRYARATHGLARLVVLSSSGTVSLEALRWCAGVGIGVVVLDPFGGELHLTSGGVGNDDPRLRRSQALAVGTEVGLDVTRYLVTTKLVGQASVVAHRFEACDAAQTIQTLAEMVADADSLESIRQLEAAAANSYFAAWSALEVPFIRRDVPKVPDHWRVFEGRRSAINPGIARSATDPVNALLNYGYRLLEAEGRIACLAIGLDPGLGVLHADMKGRDSMVLDLMEAARPMVDQYVLDLIAARSLTKIDFDEDRRGVLRLLAPLSHRVAEAMPNWALALAPVVEHVANILGEASPYDVSVPSVLTRDKHKVAARRRVTAEASADRTATTSGPNASRLSPRSKARQGPKAATGRGLPRATCRGCGGVLPSDEDRSKPRRSWCEDCLPAYRAEVDASMNAASRVAAEQVRELTGVLPTHTAAARGRRQDANRRRQLARLAWESEHGGTSPDVEWYSEQIAPHLVQLSLQEIARALGVSTSSASKFRRGLRVPAPQHWRSLAELVGAEDDRRVHRTQVPGASSSRH
jgi:CRISPR-associated endonuclease Cas1